MGGGFMDESLVTEYVLCQVHYEIFFLFTAIYSLLFHVDIVSFQAYLGNKIRSCEWISLKSWNVRPGAKMKHRSTEITWKKRYEMINPSAHKSVWQKRCVDGSQSKLCEAWLVYGRCNNQVVLQMSVSESVSILWLDVHHAWKWCITHIRGPKLSKSFCSFIFQTCILLWCI